MSADQFRNEAIDRAADALLRTIVDEVNAGRASIKTSAILIGYPNAIDVLTIGCGRAWCLMRMVEALEREIGVDPGDFAKIGLGGHPH